MKWYFCNDVVMIYLDIRMFVMYADILDAIAIAMWIKYMSCTLTCNRVMI